MSDSIPGKMTFEHHTLAYILDARVGVCVPGTHGDTSERMRSTYETCTRNTPVLSTLGKHWSKSSHSQSHFTRMYLSVWVETSQWKTNHVHQDEPNQHGVVQNASHRPRNWAWLGFVSLGGSAPTPHQRNEKYTTKMAGTRVEALMTVRGIRLVPIEGAIVPARFLVY